MDNMVTTLYFHKNSLIRTETVNEKNMPSYLYQEIMEFVNKYYKKQKEREEDQKLNIA